MYNIVAIEEGFYSSNLKNCLLCCTISSGITEGVFPSLSTVKYLVLYQNLLLSDALTPFVPNNMNPVIYCIKIYEALSQIMLINMMYYLNPYAPCIIV